MGFKEQKEVDIVWINKKYLAAERVLNGESPRSVAEDLDMSTSGILGVVTSACRKSNEDVWIELKGQRYYDPTVNMLRDNKHHFL